MLNNIKILNKIFNYLSSKLKIREDLIMHYVICLIPSVIFGWYGAIFALGLGIGKEYGDHCNPLNKWDWLDMCANLLGIISGLTINIIIQ